MKKIFSLTAAILILLGCDHQATSGNSDSQQDESRAKAGTVMAAKADQPRASISPPDLLTLFDAEKILGEPAHLTDSGSGINGDTATYKSSYTANSKDVKTGKTGVIYFLYEKYALVSSAQKNYSSIKTANETHGIKELHDLGDEAYFHTDGQNFYFILARKGDKMFRMKVNKITSSTSLDEFNLIAKNITAAL